MFVSWSSGPSWEHFYQKASRLSFERSPGLMRVCLECFHKLGRERWRACWRPPQSLQIPDLKDRVPWRASLRAVDCSLHSPFEITLQTNNPSPCSPGGPCALPVRTGGWFASRDSKTERGLGSQLAALGLWLIVLWLRAVYWKSILGYV